MQAYFVVTGVIFALIALAHLIRLMVEGRPGLDPGFLLGNLAIAAIGGGLAVWAAQLFFRLRRERDAKHARPASGRDAR
jgi:hypothetical protein